MLKKKSMKKSMCVRGWVISKQGRKMKYIIKGKLGFKAQYENHKTSPLGLGHYQIEKWENMMMVILIWRKGMPLLYKRGN